MDQCSHEVRAEYWKGIIKACGQRPAGQSAKSWMDENGICEQSYYHWQRKFRKQAYGLIKESAAVPAASEKADTAFVEIPYKLYSGTINLINHIIPYSLLSQIMFDDISHRTVTASDRTHIISNFLHLYSRIARTPNQPFPYHFSSISPFVILISFPRISIPHIARSVGLNLNIPQYQEH